MLLFHVIFCTKYRYKLLVHDVRQILSKALCDVSERHKVDILYACSWLDHVHLIVRLRPCQSLSETVRIVKGYTSHRVRLEIPQLRRLRGFWQCGYFARTVGYDLPRLLRYLDKKHFRLVIDDKLKKVLSKVLLND